MYRDYKVYFKNWNLLITADRLQKKENFIKVYADNEAQSFLVDPSILFNDEPYGNILLMNEKPGEVMCKLLDMTDIVIAGGGIVKNERGEILLIHRRGMWDMPKGKIELEEKIIDGAKREVEEETGVKIKSVLPEPVRTYHAYKLKGKNSIKETSWYEMEAEPGQLHLVPQAEEDIDRALWVHPSELGKYMAGAHPLIKDLIHKYSN